MKEEFRQNEALLKTRIRELERQIESEGMYVCMYVCMLKVRELARQIESEGMYACMYVRMYVCMYVC